VSGRRLAAWGAALGAVLAATAPAACHRGGESEEGDHVQPVVGARTAVATAQPFTERVQAIGTVVARAGHVAALSAPGPSRVSRVYVTVGAHVAPGEPLVALDQTTFRAATQSAEAALAAAERAHERAERLSEAGIIPRKELEQATADLAKARADAATARRAAQLATLRAPIGGVVTRMDAVLGAAVDASQPLVEVADPTALDVLLTVAPGEAARVHPGAAVTLVAGEGAGGEPLGAGSVADVAGTVDTTTRGVAVRVRAPATLRPLRIGETVFGRIVVATRPGAIVVPAEALVPEGERFKVFVVDAGGIAHARVVTVGARADSLVEITSGLASGERVVTYGAYGVEDSARVIPLQQAKP
jgi:RND family efflux transporter MFP subunit